VASTGDCIVLLPERRRFAGQPLDPALAARIGRGDHLHDGLPGETAQLQRYFEVTPAGWPIAAITRQLDRGDAGTDAWLRADPAFVRAEMTGARLMACGSFGIDDDEAEELLAVLRPAFAEAELPIDAGGPGRWYLKLPVGTAFPDLAPPSEALGADVFAFLPVGAAGRRWRALANEAQVVLHNHPRNAARVQAGKPPVNSPWFWGGGELPAQLLTDAEIVDTDDADLLALASFATPPATPGNELRDLRRVRDWTQVEAQVRPALGRDSRFAAVRVDFADGVAFELRGGQGWRFWRRPLDPRQPIPSEGGRR
jgi:hypothetical protein